MEPKLISQLKSLPCYVLLTTIVFLLLSCKKQFKIEVMDKVGSIEGKIEAYNGKFKSGKLTYFDAIGRIVNSEIFTIDTNGFFNLKYDIPHPLYHAAYFEVQGKYYDIYLEPGKNIKININGNKIEYLNDNGLINKQIEILEDSINKKFKIEIDHCRFLHETKIDYQDYLKEIKNLERIQLEYIDNLENTYKFEPAVYNALKKKLHYTTAKYWINFRHDYTTKRPRPRDTLFTDFYKDLFHAYPLNDINAMVTREYIDYIANVKNVFSRQELKESNIEILKTDTSFSENEVKLIERVINGDTAVRNSGEWKKFYNTENIKKLTELSKRYYFTNVLKSCKDFPKGIGRDLIISQSICNFYFNDTYIKPTDIERKTISKLIQNKFVLDYLRDKENSFILAFAKENKVPQIPIEIKKVAESLSKEMIGKFKGKVVYLDFWATWCGPCRREIPDSKVLIEQFRDKDFVFVSLCCKSTKHDWESTLEMEELQGEQYFVIDSDYDLLSSLYGVDGFPTYILINKSGDVASYDAPRPSSKEIIYEEIQKLLE